MALAPISHAWGSPLPPTTLNSGESDNMSASDLGNPPGLAGQGAARGWVTRAELPSRPGLLAAAAGTAASRAPLGHRAPGSWFPGRWLEACGSQTLTSGRSAACDPPGRFLTRRGAHPGVGQTRAPRPRVALCDGHRRRLLRLLHSPAQPRRFPWSEKASCPPVASRRLSPAPRPGRWRLPGTGPRCLIARRFPTRGLYLALSPLERDL